MDGSTRWLGGKLQAGMPLSADDVRRLGRYASHQTHRDVLHEYDLGQFWITDMREEDPVRRLHADQDRVPEGPWFHGPMCDCGECGAVSV